MYEITMPKLSDSMEEGKIIAWKVKEGARVTEGDILAEVESDKAAMELECFHSGILAKVVHGDNSEVRVGEVIGYIAAEEEAAPGGEAPEKMPALKEAKLEEPKTPPAVAPREPGAEEAVRLRVTPFARKLAEVKGVDLSRVKGTGPSGRITAQDVEASAAKGVAPEMLPVPKRAAEPKTGTSEPVTSKAYPDEEIPPIDVAEGEAVVEEATYRQKTQARRVTASKHVIPHFYITRGVDVTALMARKDELKEKCGATITHVLMLACLRAIKLHPEVNRSYDRGRIIKWKGINLGLAVDTDEGLTVAVLRDAQDMTLPQIVEGARALAEKARAGKLSADERRHPTFTISSLGMFDVEQFEAIINPPSAITLAVGAALPAPLVKDGRLEAGKVMKLSLSCDHRIIDGVTAAKFLGDLKSILEDDKGLLSGG